MGGIGSAAIWIPAALLAGMLQAGRSSLQVRLRGTVTAHGAGVVRYAFGLPFALLFAGVWLALGGIVPSVWSAAFFACAAGGGLAQILGTQMLIEASHRRGFVVGTAFSKLEAIVAAIASAALLQERLPLLAWIGIVIGAGGILAISVDPRRERLLSLATLTQPAALLGLGAASFYALTAVLVKKASVLIGISEPFGAALLTLAVVMALQTAMQGGWVLLREPGTLRSVWAMRRQSTLVGLFSAAGSACWFIGFALAPVALVRLVGQVELLLTVWLSHRLLGERPRRTEVAGLFLVAAGSLIALLSVMR